MHTYYLEYDSPRAGGFEPLQYLPAHKNVILGLITSKFPQLEDMEEMKGKVFAAADCTFYSPSIILLLYCLSLDLSDRKLRQNVKLKQEADTAQNSDSEWHALHT